VTPRKPYAPGDRYQWVARLPGDQQGTSFACTARGFARNAEVNAARNIAAGHAVTARGGFGVARPVNREPQPLLQPV